ncbi:YPDG domain-containing protein [Corynebacterium sp. HMSC055D05]|uniref:YPDG domain-containing protein n=2 Tax=Corynebacterium TaxID=1716 RepID=UPI0008A1F1E5|nr:YPDG domain-containing protein [Corynebacterium sp. HMSC055D05]OFL93680.1 hypothetical protein HMPREF2734_00525 [Corynebacterium sp. HMSC055D05]
MKFSRAVVAIATAAAVFTGGVTVPQSLAETRTTQEANLHWPTARVVPGDTVEVKPEGSFSSTMRFSGEEDYLGYRLTTNPLTGVATITVSEDVIPGESIRFNITTTDGVRELDYDLDVTVVDSLGTMARESELDYPEVLTAHEAEGVSRPFGDVPEGTTFDVVSPEHFEATISDDGTLSVKQLDELPTSSSSIVAVTATFADGSTKTFSVPVLVTKFEDGERSELANATIEEYYDFLFENRFKPEWEVANMAGDEPGYAEYSGGFAEGSKFKLRDDLVPNLRYFGDVSVDPDNGTVTVSPKRPIKGFRRFDVPVEVEGPDGRVGVGSAEFFIDEPGRWQSEKAVVEYPEVSSPTPGPFTSNPYTEVPEETWFELHGKAPEGTDVDVNRQTGEVTVQTPDRTRPGTTLILPILAHFPDGSRKHTDAKLILTEPEVPEASTTHVTYPTQTINPGETVTIRPDNLPEGAAVSVNETFGHGSSVSVDEKTGAVTIAASEDARRGSAGAKLWVIFKDGSYHEVWAYVDIEEPTPTPTPEPLPEPTEQPTPEPEEPQPAPEPEPEATEKPTPDVFEPADVTEEEPGSAEGSSTGGIIAIVLGVLAALGGLAFAAKPQLEKMGLWPDLPLPTA